MCRIAQATAGSRVTVVPILKGHTEKWSLRILLKHGLLLVVLSLIFVVSAHPLGQRVRTPRIQPLEPSEWTDEIREILGPRA
jgi:hypothetical protein